MSRISDQPFADSSSSRSRRLQRLHPSKLDLLIPDARRGSKDALDTLMEGLSEHLWTKLHSRTRRRPIGGSFGSSDLVQDTLLRVRDQFSKFERETFADFVQWAKTVLYNRRLEWLRNHKNRNTDPHKRALWQAITNRHGGIQEQLVLHQEETDRVYEQFERLKPNEKFIIQLRVFEELSFKQIAAITGSNHDAVRKSCARALDRLRKQLCVDDVRDIGSTRET